MKRLSVMVILVVLWLGILTGGQSAGGAHQLYAPLIQHTSDYPRLSALTYGATLWSATPRVSADGGVVAITTAAPFDGADTNGEMDVYVWERQRGAWRWLTAGSDQPSQVLSVSADGRYVLLRSWANTLAADDGNGGADVFRYDLETEQLELVSATPEGLPANGNSGEAALSANGQWVLFSNDSDNLDATFSVCEVERCPVFLYLRNMQSGVTTGLYELSFGGAVPEPKNLWVDNGGQAIAYEVLESIANNCDAPVLYHYDLGLERSTILATSSEILGERIFVSGLTVSADGRWAGYAEERQTSSGTVHTLWMRDINPGGPITLIGLPTTDYSQARSTTPDGGCGGIGALPQVSLSTDGAQAGFVQTDSNGTRHAALYHRQTQAVTVVSRPRYGTLNGAAENVVVSGNGNTVLFQSDATNLVGHDPNGAASDIFVWDRVAVAGTLPLSTHTPFEDQLSPSSSLTPRGGTLLNITGASEHGGSAPYLSADGSTVLFSSLSADLIEDDTNNATDAFVWERATDTMTRVSVKSDGSQGEGQSFGLGLSADGRYVLFITTASFTSDDPDTFWDLYRHDRVTGKTQMVTRGFPSEPLVGTENAAISADGQRVFFSEGEFLYNQESYIYDFVSATYTAIKAPNGGRIRQPDNFGFSADGQSVLYGDFTDSYCFGGQLYRQRTEDGTRRLLHRTDSGYGLGGDEVYNATYYSPTLSVGGEGWLTGFYRFDAPALAGRSGLWATNGAGEPAEIYAFEAGACQQRQLTQAVQSENGARVAFRAPDLNTALFPTLTDDSNGYYDILLYDRATATYTLLSTSNAAGQPFDANNYSASPSISANGRVVAFSSSATNLAQGDTNGVSADVFVWVE